MVIAEGFESKSPASRRGVSDKSHEMTEQTESLLSESAGEETSSQQMASSQLKFVVGSGLCVGMGIAVASARWLGACPFIITRSAQRAMMAGWLAAAVYYHTLVYCSIEAMLFYSIVKNSIVYYPILYYSVIL